MMQQIAVPQSSAVERVKIRSFLGLLPLQLQRSWSEIEIAQFGTSNLQPQAKCKLREKVSQTHLLILNPQDWCPNHYYFRKVSRRKQE